MPLSTPGCGSAFWAAVAMTTVATDADGEYRAARWLAAISPPQDSILVNTQMGHQGMMPWQGPK